MGRGGIATPGGFKGGTSGRDGQVDIGGSAGTDEAKRGAGGRVDGFQSGVGVDGRDEGVVDKETGGDGEGFVRGGLDVKGWIERHLGEVAMKRC